VSFDNDDDDQAEDTWDATHGAIFLANLDSDSGDCKYDESASDAELAACNDGADEVVNGDADLEDMAPVRVAPWSDAPEGTTWRIKVSEKAKGYVRLFMRGADGQYVVYNGEDLTAAQLRSGADFKLEGRDIVRDRQVWDGFVDLTLEVVDQEQTLSDIVRLRVAPLLTSHQLQKAEAVYVTEQSSSSSKAFRDELEKAVIAAGVPQGQIGIQTGGDQWTQDFFETGYMFMPGPAGQAKVITVFIRSANVDDPKSAKFPLRFAGRVVYLARGKDVAALQEVDLKHSGQMDTLDSFGNLETIPPHSYKGKNYPFGRILRGSTPQYHPDPMFHRMIEAQGVQPSILIDTSWLLVSHVDETFSFVKAPNSPRGWAVLVNDAALAIKMLQNAQAAGHGTAKLFVGKKWSFSKTAETTIDGVLADPEVMAASAEAVVEVQGQVDVLKGDVGIGDEDLVKIPFTHLKTSGYSVAHIPGMVNGIYLPDTVYGSPRPYGPQIDGVDIFEKQLSEALAPLGITTYFVEDWDLYHAMLGEVHCGSNTLREAQTGSGWWEVIQ
jgi:protein-arginine deiminase